MADLIHDTQDPAATRVVCAPTFLVRCGAMNAASTILDVFAGAPER